MMSGGIWLVMMEWCNDWQAISEPDERYAAYCASSDFIREHVFPGGHLPSMGAMVDAARGTGLSVEVRTAPTVHFTVVQNRHWWRSSVCDCCSACARAPGNAGCAAVANAEYNNCFGISCGTRMLTSESSARLLWLRLRVLCPA
jgi:hypothetical protein